MRGVPSYALCRWIDRWTTGLQAQHKLWAFHLLYRNMSSTRDRQWETYSHDAELYWVHKAKRRESELTKELQQNYEHIQKMESIILTAWRRSDSTLTNQHVAAYQLRDFVQQVQRRQKLDALRLLSKTNNKQHVLSDAIRLKCGIFLLERGLIQVAKMSGLRALKQWREAFVIPWQSPVEVVSSSPIRGSSEDKQKQHQEAAGGTPRSVTTRVVHVNQNNAWSIPDTPRPANDVKTAPSVAAFSPQPTSAVWTPRTYTTTTTTSKTVYRSSPQQQQPASPQMEPRQCWTPRLAPHSAIHQRMTQDSPAWLAASPPRYVQTYTPRHERLATVVQQVRQSRSVSPSTRIISVDETPLYFSRGSPPPPVPPVPVLLQQQQHPTPIKQVYLASPPASRHTISIR